MALALHIPLTVRGGGHSYTCQGSNSGGIVLDMRSMRHIQVNESVPSITVGAGLVWEDVLIHLRTHYSSNYTVVHGQCTSVGVAGFTLHGGVHFGGLSELYGLGSDNLLALSAVLANGTAVELSDTHFSLDNQTLPHSESSRGLWRAFRGSGSSFGVITSLTLKLHPKPALRSALSVLSVDAGNSGVAQKFISDYMRAVPSSVSLTLFGLDAYFKAYFFVIRFSSNKLSAARNDISSLYKTLGTNLIHFIIEASWLEEDYPTKSCASRLVDSGSTVRCDVLEVLTNIHEKFRASKDYNHIAIVRKWFASEDMWTVPSYDSVWGTSHAYGGATITTSLAGEARLLRTAVDQYRLHLGSDTSHCSDCVLVLHRIGEGLRRKVSADSSLNYRLRRSYLWVEFDCGHFYRQKLSWPRCSNFIDSVQRSLDNSVAKTDRTHYPNVPNLMTDEWRDQYFGRELHELLSATKTSWDPHNIFSHRQSVIASNAPDEEYRSSHEILNFMGHSNCSAAYDSLILAEHNLFAIGLLVTVVACAASAWMVCQLRKNFKSKS